jgi:hypothetical protein
MVAMTVGPVTLWNGSKFRNMPCHYCFKRYEIGEICSSGFRINTACKRVIEKVTTVQKCGRWDSRFESTANMCSPIRRNHRIRVRLSNKFCVIKLWFSVVRYTTDATPNMVSDLAVRRCFRT